MIDPKGEAFNALEALAVATVDLSLIHICIMVITQASQACDAGSIPVARSKKNVRQWLIAIAVFLLSG